MKNMEKNIKKVLQKIYAAEQKYQRKNGSVQLLVVSKTQSPEMIEKAITAGLTDFGENYLQEALPKIRDLVPYRPCWYFIGPVQSNKTRQIAENFSWVLSIDRNKTAQRLGDARPQEFGPLNVCIQVNTSGEPSKSGVRPSEVYPLVSRIMEHSALKLRGIMGIPAPTTAVDEQRASFRQLKDIFDDINNQGIPMDTLSMGMSGDLEPAIAEGSTMVRIGTAIFGERKKAPT
jgi:pyridoxal phosphate enzyme (YggS family)